MSDLAEIRIKNTLRLFDEFKEANSPGAAPLLGLEKAFSARLQISAAQWSQLKGGHRSIGATLARQFEARCSKPAGWLDERHEPAPWAAAPAPAPLDGPRDPEERFAIALFLTAYRANPQKMKTRLLDLATPTHNDRFAMGSRQPARALACGASNQRWHDHGPARDVAFRAPGKELRPHTWPR